MRGAFCNSATPCCGALVCNFTESLTCGCGDDMGTPPTKACDGGGGAGGTSGAGGSGGGGQCRTAGQPCLLPDLPCCSGLMCVNMSGSLHCMQN
jgi:hypothetical protein